MMTRKRFPQEIVLGIEALVGVGHFLFLLALMSRLQGQEYVGAFVVVSTWSAVFSILATAGMPLLIMREMAKRPESRHELIAAGLAVCMATSLVSAGLMVLVTGSMGYDSGLGLGLVLGSALLVPRTFTMLARATCIALARAERFVWVKVVEYLLVIGAGSYVIIHDLGIGLLFLTILISSCAAALVFVIDLKRTLIPAPWSLSWDNIRQLVGPAFSFAMIDASVMLFWRVDVLMLSKMTTLGMTGLYAAATRFLQIFVMAPAIFSQTHLPRVARDIKNGTFDPSDLETRVRILFLLVTPAAFGIFLFAEPSLWLLFGESFVDAKPALQILMVTFVLLAMDMVMSTVYEAAGYQRNQMWIAFVGIVFNIALNVLLIPRYGFVGAAAATMISVSASCCVHWWLLARQVVLLNWLRILASPFALAGLAISPAVIFWGNFHVLALSAISALLYLGLVLLFRRQLAPFLRN